MIQLKGIAWNHTRGFTSVVATAQRYEELNPLVRITWEKRSLQAFADMPLQELVNQFDLLIMDNPHVTLAAQDQLLLPFNDYVSEAFLKELAQHSVGKSHASYHVFNKQWTLATDAATPIATWREDLVQQLDFQIPQTWQQLVEVTKKGKVAFASIPIDTLMHHYMMCIALGAPIFKSQTELAPRAVMIEAIKTYKTLVDLAPSYCLQMNPIQIYERMTQTDEIVYSPFNYGYSNYSKKNYASHVLKAGGLVTFNGKRLRSTLGGAGIAVSSKTKHAETAMQYAQFVASEKIQSGLYFEFGGQPGHRKSWLSDEVNAQCKDFFKDTLQTLDEATMRPQYYGYMHFQDEASLLIHEAVSGKSPIASVVDKINLIYKESLTH